MRFWDSSALVTLLVAEPATRYMQSLAADDPDLLVWWGSRIECVSAIARLEREGLLNTQACELAHDRLRQFAAAWHEVDPSDLVCEVAVRLLRVHPLRAADALQLAAAYTGAERRPASLEFVTLDDRLTTAARKEGFPVINPGVA